MPLLCEVSSLRVESLGGSLMVTFIFGLADLDWLSESFRFLEMVLFPAPRLLVLALRLDGGFLLMIVTLGPPLGFLSSDFAPSFMLLFNACSKLLLSIEFRSFLIEWLLCFVPNSIFAMLFWFCGRLFLSPRRVLILSVCFIIGPGLVGSDRSASFGLPPGLSFCETDSSGLILVSRRIFLLFSIELFGGFKIRDEAISF